MKGWAEEQKQNLRTEKVEDSLFFFLLSCLIWVFQVFFKIFIY